MTIFENDRANHISLLFWQSGDIAKSILKMDLGHAGVPVGSIRQQQALPSWIGGHGTVAYEQYTQQSPGSGLRTTLHPLQS